MSGPPPVIQLFLLHVAVFVEYGGNDVVYWIYWFGKGGGYIQVVI